MNRMAGNVRARSGDEPISALGPAHWPGDELLVAAICGRLTAAEQLRLDDHLQTCSLCRDAIVVVRQRSLLDTEISATVPAEVLQRASTALRKPSPASHAVLARCSVTRRSPPHRDRRTAMRRSALLAAAAAAALLLVTRSAWRPSTRPTQTRSVPLAQRARVTAADAVARARPEARAAVVARLERGRIVEINGGTGEWYRIVLPGGGEGWVDRRAFE